MEYNKSMCWRNKVSTLVGSYHIISCLKVSKSQSQKGDLSLKVAHNWYTKINVWLTVCEHSNTKQLTKTKRKRENMHPYCRNEEVGGKGTKWNLSLRQNINAYLPQLKLKPTNTWWRISQFNLPTLLLSGNLFCKTFIQSCKQFKSTTVK